MTLEDVDIANDIFFSTHVHPFLQRIALGRRQISETGEDATFACRWARVMRWHDGQGRQESKRAAPFFGGQIPIVPIFLNFKEGTRHIEAHFLKF